MKATRANLYDTSKTHTNPPGRIKVIQALITLLREKSFNAITWAEIAQTAGVNEALIYKYFGDKRGLLHQVLTEYLENFIEELVFALKGIKGAFNKLRKTIWFQVNLYDKERVFARILLLEVRNFPGYFHSETYQIVRDYSNIVKNIIEEGIEQGEIRENISIHHIRDVVLGAIEHVCLPGVLFDREISPDECTEDICELLFPGLEKKE